MPYLSREQIASIGFKSLGKNVLISDKASIHNADRIEIGYNSRIDDFCVLSGKVSIGRNVHIAVFCNIAGGSEGVAIEDFSGVSYGSQVFSQSDDYTGSALTGPTIPAKYRHETKAAIRIGRHCIVGANSLIFPGVCLGEGCSVGAMSVVTRSTDEWAIYVGIPARKLKDRKRDLLILEQDYLKSEQE